MKNVIAIFALLVGTIALGQNQAPVSGINGVFVLPNVNIQEEFCGYTPGTTQLIGEYGWDLKAITGGTVAAIASVANHPCLITLTATATTGDGVGIYCCVSGVASSGILFPGNSTNWQSEHIAEINQTATGSYRIGFGSALATTAVPTNGIYFRFLNGTDTYVMACSDSASTETCTSTGVAVTALDYVDFLMSSATTGSVTFTVNDITHPGSGSVTICASGCSATATLPTVVLSPFFNVVSTSNTADLITVDYFGYQQVLTR